MAVFKCKMCGGTLEVNNESVATCEYCGTQQTLPKTKDDTISNLFNRANNLRLKCEFDKAAQIYEKIVQQDDSEAEAHWGLVLCKYGIEYVEDPKTFKRIPTCHRTLYEAVTADADYQAAIDYSDTLQQAIYESEARAIDKIQKDILAIVKNEKPYDVFICYKETDETGKRTIDSTIGNDIYHQLTQEGFKVFYAAITLEDKLGQEYEPCIFAALNSAKVMLVLGTKPEYFNAVWVKNEWSRFLNLMKTDRSKLLIPCYRDMDAYELPEEFAHLQAQDMSKIGFINDVVRGINKLIKPAEAQSAAKETVVQAGIANTAPLLKRAFMFLEDGDWRSADEYCEKVLDINPECAEAYLGKLMADLRVRKQENLKNLKKPFELNNNYQKAIRFGDEELINTLKGYLQCATDNMYDDQYNKAVMEMGYANSEKQYLAAAEAFELIPNWKDSAEKAKTCREKAVTVKLDVKYFDAVAKINSAMTRNDYLKLAEIFESLAGYKDSSTLAEECFEKAEIARKDAILDDAKQKLSLNTVSSVNSAIYLLNEIPDWKDANEQLTACKNRLVELEANKKDSVLHKATSKMQGASISDYEEAIELLQSVSGWKDADEKIALCNRKIEELKAKEEARRLALERAKKEEAEKAKRNKIVAVVVVLALCVAIVFLIILNKAIIPNNKYNSATEALNAGNIVEAYETFTELDGYKDSAEKAKSVYEEYKVEKLYNVEVGDYIFFGAYWQDIGGPGDKEDIEWLVLDEQDGKVLVISKYGLKGKWFNSWNQNEPWENSAIREWLNKEFIFKAFTEEEMNLIPTVTVTADKNPQYSTSPGNDTQDQLFLLSIDEVNNYFRTDADRQCVATEIAIEDEVYTDSNGKCSWWLRTPGLNDSSVAIVNFNGTVSCMGHPFVSSNAVRPAMWIDLTKLN